MIEKLKINSIHDGLPLDILIATCNNPKAIVQIVHGMCEYKEPVSYTHLDVYKRQIL